MLARVGLLSSLCDMSSELPEGGEKPKKKLLGAIILDLADHVSLSNTYEVLREDWSEIRKAWKTLLILAVVLGGAIWYIVAEHYSSSHADEERVMMADYNRKVAGRDKEVTSLRFNLQQARAERDKAQIVLQPWIERAQKQFPFDDVITALNKLDAKTETVLAMFQSSIVNPLNEPITAATCTVRFQTSDGNNGDGKMNIGTGGYAAFGLGDAALLLAGTVNHIARPGGMYEFTGTAGVFDAIMDKPVHSIIRAEYIQIGLHKNLLKKSDVSILGGTIVWVINNRISLRYAIPPQKVDSDGPDGYRITVRDLKTGIAQLEQLANPAGTMPPSGSPSSPSSKPPQSTIRGQSAPPLSRE